MKKLYYLLSIVYCLLSVSLAAAQYSIDISGLNKNEYNPGEELTFKIILLENQSQIIEQVNYKITDALNKKEITGITTSNKETTIKIENDFLSGIWTITANYSNSKVERTFTVGENPGVEFLIEGDELIIRNTGNIRYTKTIQIKIGDTINSYAQNIQAGDEKILKLISAKGIYNIEVDDGKTKIKREGIELFGTGNVVGAIDPELVGYTGFAGTEDPQSLKNRPISLKKLPLALIFIATITILAALIIIERKLTKSKK